MILGITGTRDGWTPQQEREFRGRILQFMPTHFHHGDCIGVDDQAANVVNEMLSLCRIISHPPSDGAYRARNPHAWHTRSPMGYLSRNLAIVNACDVLIACPKEMEPQARGGTWYTYRYAKEKGKATILILPDGQTEEAWPVT